jgi:tetratricopeptide (TPR) repeat protein
MRQLLSGFLLFFFTSSSFAQQSEMDLGTIHYLKRSEGASEELVALPENINKAIAHFSNALTDSSTQASAAHQLLKCYYFKGNCVEIEKENKLLVYNESVKLGEEMTKKYPNSVQIKYWLLVNKAKWGETSGIMKAARAGLADKLKTLSEEVIEMDPNYLDGAAYMMLGIVHYKTPYIPFVLSWPDDDKAIEYLEKAVELQPGHLMSNLYLGQVLYDEGFKDRGIEILEEVSASKPGEEYPLEDEKDIRYSRVMLAKFKK